MRKRNPANAAHAGDRGQRRARERQRAEEPQVDQRLRGAAGQPMSAAVAATARGEAGDDRGGAPAEVRALDDPVAERAERER